MPQLLALGFQIAFVVRIGFHFDRHLLDDFQTVTLPARRLFSDCSSAAGWFSGRGPRGFARRDRIRADPCRSRVFGSPRRCRSPAPAICRPGSSARGRCRGLPAACKESRRARRRPPAAWPDAVAARNRSGANRTRRRSDIRCGRARARLFLPATSPRTSAR